ncbi:stage II sporulation protein R [Clostridium sp. CAG:354]|jgi:stage II sporulation protein R|uniref:stage II sporulation protein R n=1 Tax=Candidatus Merdicola sp. TaxID=3085652 RepID=UPI0003407E22|nr:stage II sporulation protein R [Clostridium sp.]MEE0268504.1 stage II sporulation protein R [Clostridia bacterium]CDE11551.1 stage II sporulation protein R [Clostridium sp. CAG:354]
MKKKLNFIFILTILVFIYIALLSFNYSKAISSNLSDSVFRLHIIANSDSSADQELKLKVRDKIIEYMNTLTSNSSDKKDVISIVNNHLDSFKEIALNTIKENGYNYDVNIEIGNFHFPTKSYGDISFPAGNYDALKIEIGDAIGQNWWCVLFPPLCFVNSSTGVVPDDSKNTLKENINSESYEIISEGNNSNDNTSDIKIKFKIIEFFNNFTK